MPVTFIISTSLECLVRIKTIPTEINIIGEISDCIKHVRYFQIVST